MYQDLGTSMAPKFSIDNQQVAASGGAPWRDSRNGTPPEAVANCLAIDNFGAIDGNILDLGTIC